LAKKSEAREPAAFTVLWSATEVAQLKERYPGAPPRCCVLLGGWNQQTRFGRAGVRPGDTVYPVHVAKKRLYVLTRLVVTDIDDDGVTERLNGALGARFQFDLAVPAELLERWRFAGGREPRPIKFLVDGEVTRANSFQGVYRLSRQTASDLFGLILDREARDHSISFS
jgi:hypothetical protein